MDTDQSLTLSWTEWIIVSIPPWLFSLIGKVLNAFGLVPGHLKCDFKYLLPQEGTRDGFTHRYVPGMPLMKMPLPIALVRSDAKPNVGPYCAMPYHVNVLPFIRDFDVHEDDVWVCTFPKSGTTWCQMIVSAIVTGKFEHDVDLEDRFPMVEFDSRGVEDPDIFMARMSNMPKPRMYKTHLPFEFLPDRIHKAKVVCCIRNVKDTLCSLAPFMAGLKMIQYKGTPDDLARNMVDMKSGFSGPFGAQTKSYWNMRNEDNVLVMIYEKMLLNHRGSVVEIAKFLGRDLSDEFIDRIVKETEFGAMKQNKSWNYKWMNDTPDLTTESFQFMRKGQCGSWKYEMSADCAAALDDFQEKEFAGTGIEWIDTM